MLAESDSDRQECSDTAFIIAIPYALNILSRLYMYIQHPAYHVPHTATHLYTQERSSQHRIRPSESKYLTCPANSSRFTHIPQGATQLCNTRSPMRFVVVRCLTD